MELANMSKPGSCPWAWDRWSFLKPGACYETNFNAQWCDGCAAAWEMYNNE
jgi:hypothetical protein